MMNWPSPYSQQTYPPPPASSTFNSSFRGASGYPPYPNSGTYYSGYSNVSPNSPGINNAALQSDATQLSTPPMTPHHLSFTSPEPTYPYSLPLSYRNIFNTSQSQPAAALSHELPPSSIFKRESSGSSTTPQIDIHEEKSLSVETDPEPKRKRSRTRTRTDEQVKDDMKRMKPSSVYSQNKILRRLIATLENDLKDLAELKQENMVLRDLIRISNEAPKPAKVLKTKKSKTTRDPSIFTDGNVITCNHFTLYYHATLKKKERKEEKVDKDLSPSTGLHN
jgi:hypothetical protein